MRSPPPFFEDVVGFMERLMGWAAAPGPGRCSLPYALWRRISPKSGSKAGDDCVASGSAGRLHGHARSTGLWEAAPSASPSFLGGRTGTLGRTATGGKLRPQAIFMP